MSNFKDTLMTALRSSVQHFNSSQDPDASVVKAAQDYGFNVEQTKRLVETFNTARTLYHYKSAADRSTSFALADIDKVLPALFESAPEVKAAEQHDNSCYSHPERDWRKPQAELEKAAEIVQETDAGVTAIRAMRGLRNHQQVIKIAQDEARVASASAAFCLTKLAGLFARGSDRSLLQDQYARLVVGFGRDPEHGPVVQKLAEFVPAKDQAPTTMIEQYRQHAVLDDRDLAQHLVLLKEAKEFLEIAAELTAGAGVLSKEAESFERDYMVALRGTQEEPGLAGFFRPSFLKTAQGLPPNPAKNPMTKNMYGETVPADKEPAESTPGIADLISDSVGGGIAKSVGSYVDTGVTRAFTEPTARANKDMADRLRNVQRQIMLQDLMVNDPVLSEEPSEKVIEAYNAIHQMAPEVASNKEVVRAILRQTVHSVAVSPYEADIWTKLETSLRNLRGGRAPRPVNQEGKE